MLKKIVFLIASTIIPSFAQQSITLNSAWQIASEKNLSLQQMEETILQAAEEIEINRADYFPFLSASGSFFYISDIPRLQLPLELPGDAPGFEADLKDWYNFSLNLNQPIFTGFRTKNLVKSAREQHQAQMIQKSVTQKQLFFQIGLLFYELQLNLTQQEVLQESINRADFHLQNARNLFRAQQSTAFDTLEAANRKLQHRTDWMNLRNLFENQLIRFAHLLNEDAPLTVERMPPETPGLALAPLDEYLAAAAKNRPELQQLDALEKAQLYRSNALKSAFYPQIFANLSLNTLLPGISILEREWVNFYTVSVGFQWNIWNWKQDQRRVQQARLEIDKIDLQTRQLLQGIRQEVTEAHKLLQNTREQIGLQEQLAAQQQERYRITREFYLEGQATNLDLSAAETALTESQLRLQQSYIRWHQLRLQLDFATGEIGKKE